MQLPGGVKRGAELMRGFQFKPVTGELELALADCAHGDLPLARRVTKALQAALAALAGDTVNEEQVHNLSVGDRQYLMRRLACHLGLDVVWLSNDCVTCGSRFDARIEQSQLPVKDAGKGFPSVRLRFDGKSITLRVPNGADQEAIAHLSDSDALRVLVRRLSQRLPWPELSDEHIEAIERAVEAVAPEVTIEVSTNCPNCDASNIVTVDPYLCLTQCGQTLLQDVHTLARHYHWSESEILRLPRRRRELYLRMLDRDRAMTHQLALS